MESIAEEISVQIQFIKCLCGIREMHSTKKKK